jgi:hypothetical protein
MAYELKAMMVEHVFNIAPSPSKIILYADDARALVEQTFTEMRAKKPGPTRDQHAVSRCTQNLTLRRAVIAK